MSNISKNIELLEEYSRYQSFFNTVEAPGDGTGPAEATTKKEDKKQAKKTKETQVCFYDKYSPYFRRKRIFWRALTLAKMLNN